jgi:hypothetical protein
VESNEDEEAASSSSVFRLEVLCLLPQEGRIGGKSYSKEVPRKMRDTAGKMPALPL